MLSDEESAWPIGAGHEGRGKRSLRCKVIRWSQVQSDPEK